MSSNFFDIPFRRSTYDSDFICKDGELLSVDNALVLCEGQPIEPDSLSSSFLPDILNFPPVPDVDFALVRTTLAGWHIHPDAYPSKTLVASDPSMDYWTKMGAQLLQQFVNDARNQMKFVAPVYAMAAWRTYEGNYLSLSDPVKLTSNSEVPLVATDGDISAKELEFKIAGAICNLYFRMRAPEVLRDWVGKIESLVIMVSKPTENYNSYQAFLPSKRVNTDSLCESLDLETGIISWERICTETLPLAWKANLTSSSEAGPDTRIFYPFVSVPLSEVDIADGWTDAVNSKISFPVERMYENGIRYSGIGTSDKDVLKSKTVTIAGRGEEMSIATRPLKLTGGNFKMMRKVYLRGSYTPANITINVYGSRDMLKWWLISKRKGGTVAILPRSSFRFYRLQIFGHLSPTESLQGLTFM